MPENIHDKGYKRILSKKKHFLSFLQDFVNKAWVSQINEDDLEMMDKEFIPSDFREKEADIIYKTKYNGTEIIFYCLLELQSTVDFTLPYRLLVYMAELTKRTFMNTEEEIRIKQGFKLPVIIPIVIYNGIGTWTAVTSYKDYLNGSEQFGNNSINFEYILLNLNQCTEADLVKPESLIASVFLMDTSRSEDAFKKNLTTVQKWLYKLTKEEQIEFFDWLRDVLKKKFKGKQESIDEALAYFEKGKVEEMTYAIERIFDEVEEKGIEKGIEKGNLDAKIKMIKKARKQGLSNDVIADLTELTVEEVIKLSE